MTPLIETNLNIYNQLYLYKEFTAKVRFSVSLQANNVSSSLANSSKTDAPSRIITLRRSPLGIADAYIAANVQDFLLCSCCYKSHITTRCFSSFLAAICHDKTTTYSLISVSKQFGKARTLSNYTTSREYQTHSASRSSSRLLLARPLSSMLIRITSTLARARPVVYKPCLLQCGELIIST